MLDIPNTIDPTDVLAQPTRAQLFRLLGELGRAATTVELAERLDLHPNGVRVHLDRMERDSLVVRASEPRPRGRPRDRWTIAPGARPGGQPPRGYHDLARWLSRVIASGRSSLRAIETTGRAIGRELAATNASAGTDGFMSSLATLGFQPTLTFERDATVTVRLENCPYRDAVLENQAAVCTLHRGVTRGLIDIMDPGARLASFEPHSPTDAGCLIQIAGITKTVAA